MMPENILRLLLETSFYGSIIGIIILIFKALLSKCLSAKWQYLIWVVLILKLLIPFGPESNISIFNALPHSVAVIQQEITAPHLNDLSVVQVNTVQTDTPANTDDNKKTFDLSKMAAYIWLAGAVILFIWHICTNLLLRYQLSKRGVSASENTVNILKNCKAQLKITKKIEVITQDIISAPSLFGIFRPKILITPNLEEMSEEQIKYTLLHELSHYKRRDIFANYLLLILQSIHWFNPIILYCFNRIRRDMEIATDEQTLLCIENTEYKAYGLALIATLEGFTKKFFAPKLPGMTGNAKDMEKRIKIISQFKKPKLLWSIIAVLIISVIGIACLTNASNTDKLPKTDNIQTTKENTVLNEAMPSPEPTPRAQEIKPSIKPEERTPAPSPTPVPASTDTKEPDTEDTSYNTISVTYDESVGELDLNQVLSLSGNKPVAPAEASLEHFCKLADYNFDTTEVYKFTVYPDVLGNISLYFDSDFSTVVANISISESGAPESGTVCMLPTDPQKIYYFHGLNPGKKYDIEISGYCPGNYNICGKILIY